MEAIGQLLLERGWISQEQLEAALHRQRELGGRLGTALLELEAVSEDLLAKLLGEQAGAPAAAIEELRAIPAEVIGLMPSKVAVRHVAVPFRQARSHVDVAMRGLPDLGTLDELSFVLGKQARVHIANEVRIFEALERYYGRGCPARLSHLLERLDRSRDRLRQGTAATPAAERPAQPRPSSPPAARQAPAPAPVAASSSSSVTAEPAPAPAAADRQVSVPLSPEEKAALRRQPAADVVKPLSLEGVQAALQAASSADEVGRALLGFLGQEFLRVVLFRVDGKAARGWLGRSPALDAYALRNWKAGFDEPSIFLNLRQGGEFFLGTLPPMPAHERLVACWNGSLDTECAVFPVRVRKRLVMAAYGDRDSLGLDGLEVQQIQRVTAKAAIAFEMLIMRRKLQKL